MNIYAVIILIAVVGEFLLEAVAALLNLRVLKEHPPVGFEELLDAEKYARSQAYLRATTRLGLASSGTALLALLLFWLAGGFPLLEAWANGFGFGPTATGTLFIGALVLLRFLLGLPFKLLSTFGVEARFGFNRSTPAVFLTDLAKGALLALLLGAPLVAGVLAFFLHAGPLAWLWCWGATTLFMLAVQYAAPTWIMPLFNTFEPMPDGALREALLAYAARVDFPLKDVMRMDGSKRSTKANAFFTGFGANKRVVLFDTLIESQSVPELVAVFAHEVGHFKRRHLVKGLVIGILHMGILFYLLSLFLTEPALHAAFGMAAATVHGGLVFFLLLYTPVEQLLSPMMLALSRKHEYEADRFALETAPDGAALGEALKKLSVNNLSNLTPHPFYVALNHSHPPVIDRLAALRTG